MDQLPELEEGTPPAQPEVTPVRPRTIKSPILGPDLPRAVNIARNKLAPGWSYRIVFGQGFIAGTEPAPSAPPQLYPTCLWKPEPERGRKTVDIIVAVASVTLRCAHLDGRRGVCGWVWRSDTEAWSFSGPAYAWMTPMTTKPYECGVREWAELMAWTNEEMAA